MTKVQVKCVDNSYHNLTIGKIYEGRRDPTTGCVNITDDLGFLCSCRGDRFYVISEETTGPDPERSDELVEKETFESMDTRIRELEADVTAAEFLRQQAEQRADRAEAEGTELRSALREALETMKMQEQREAGVAHIPAHTALYIWNSTKARITKALYNQGGNECDRLRDEVARLTKELADAKLQLDKANTLAGIAKADAEKSNEVLKEFSEKLNAKDGDIARLDIELHETRRQKGLLPLGYSRTEYAENWRFDLTTYHRDNLVWLMTVADKFFVADTGDWYGEILETLRRPGDADRGLQPGDKPNVREPWVRTNPTQQAKQARIKALVDELKELL